MDLDDLTEDEVASYWDGTWAMPEGDEGGDAEANRPR